MLLGRASGAAARLAASAAAAASGARAPVLVLPQLQRRQEQQQPLPPRCFPAAVAASRAVVATRAAASSSSSSAAAASGFASADASDKLTPADHQAVVQLLHRFDDYLNRGRHEDLGVFFVGGGGGSSKAGNGSSSSSNGTGGLEAVVRVLPPGAPAPVTHSGVQAIVAHFCACAPLARGNRHLLLNSIVEELPAGGGDDARPRVGVRSARLLVSATNPPALRASGIVEDVLVKESGGEWRFLSRELLMDPPAPAAPAA